MRMSFVIISRMILRSIAVRHGRRATSSAARIASSRSVSTTISNIESSIDSHMNQTASIEEDLKQLNFAEPSVPSAEFKNAEDEEVAANYGTFKHVTKSTGKLGSILTPYYEPRKLVTQPSAPKDITLELLMASQAHIGHSTSLWNPVNQRYIYGIRQGVHIISLEVTAAHLRRAAKVVEGVAYHGGLILFVGTREGQDRCVVKAAELVKGCHLFQRWIPGSITNGNQILSRSKMKMVDELDERIEGEVFEERIADHRSLKPDLVVCLNPLENYVLLHECGLNNIPTIGIIDTDADPTWVTYPIPANDDSLRCVQLIAGVLGRAGQSGQKKRMEAAKSGQATWETPAELRRWAGEQVEYNREQSIKRVEKAQIQQNRPPEGEMAYY